MDVQQDIEQCLAWLHTHSPALMQIETPIELTKAGIIPYLPESGEIMLMKPVPKKKELAPPGWQIAKGTRMMRMGGILQDIRKLPIDERADFVEPLACTALREGMEEVGLRLRNVMSLEALGTQDYASATTGKPKQMAMFLCAVEDRRDFTDTGPITESTAQMGWFSLSNLPPDVREDNMAILAFAKQFVTP